MGGRDPEKVPEEFHLAPNNPEESEGSPKRAPMQPKRTSREPTRATSYIVQNVWGNLYSYYPHFCPCARFQARRLFSATYMRTVTQ